MTCTAAHKAMADEFGAEPGSDIHAYFFTNGHGVGGSNLDDRLRRYAETYHVVEKTALRRSDRGVLALSHVIRDRAILERPEVMFWLTQDGPMVGFTATFFAVTGSSFHEPTLYVNGEAQDLPDLEWPIWDEDTSQLMARRHFEFDLGDSPMHEERLVNFHIWWHTQLLANFELRATVADPRLMPAACRPRQPGERRALLATRR